MSETVITILDRPHKGRPDNKKTLVRPSPHQRVLGRRRTGDLLVTFYDLTQINTGTTETPVWEDHPIIATPDYTIWWGGKASGIIDLAAQIELLDGFTSDDWDTYADYFFTHSTDDWNTLFRRIAWYDGSSGTPTEFFLQSWLGGYYAMDRPYSLPPYPPYPAYTNFLDVSLDETDPDFRTDAGAYLTDPGFYWSESGLRMRARSVPQFNTAGSWFGIYLPDFDSPSVTHKITTEYDPGASAADFSGSTIPYLTGEVDVYLFPLPCLNSVNTPIPRTTFHNAERFMLGLQYELLPRQMFPTMVELNYDLTTYTDVGGLKADYLDYMRSVPGRRAFKYQLTSDPNGGGPPHPHTGTITDIDPTDWPITAPYSNDLGDYAASEVVIAPTIVSTSPKDIVIGAFRWRGTFYYVWQLDRVVPEQILIGPYTGIRTL